MMHYKTMALIGTIGLSMSMLPACASIRHIVPRNEPVAKVWQRTLTAAGYGQSDISMPTVVFDWPEQTSASGGRVLGMYDPSTDVLTAVRDDACILSYEFARAVLLKAGARVDESRLAEISARAYPVCKQEEYDDLFPPTDHYGNLQLWFRSHRP